MVDAALCDWTDLELAGFAELAYDGFVADGIIVTEKNARALLVRRKGFPHVLAIAGTDDIRDFLDDVRCGREFDPVSGLYVRRGFFDHTEKLWSACREAGVLAGQLVLVGHSLGGAVAQIFAARLRGDPLGEVVGLVTFGSPRVGGEEFAGVIDVVYGDVHRRWVNQSDLVSRLPPAFLGYEHPEEGLHYVDSQGWLRREIGYWARLWDRVKDRFRNLDNLTPEGLGDHGIDEYIKAVRRL